MREFKFIRGIYKDESIFNIDETSKSLFALYKNGGFISFNTKNDDGFQNDIANLQPEDREIYTLRPNQFKASAKKTSDGPYSFEFEVYGNVYDNSKEFPNEVKKSAKNHIELKTSAEIIKNYPNLNLGNNNVSTEVNFTYRGEKTVSFIKRLIFKVSGFLREIKYIAANGENTSAYKTNENKIIIYGNKKQGTFFDGKLYNSANSYKKYIVSSTLLIDENTTDSVLPIANIYTVDTSKGYTLYIGDSSEGVNNIPYKDGLKLTLIKQSAADTFDKFDYTVANLDEKTIVKSYINSYQDFYIVKDGKLVNLEEDDLNGVDEICVYTSDDYKVIGNGAYIESDDDDTYYVMLEGNWGESVPITEHNAEADKELISPKITTDTFRQIEMNTLEITATEE